MATKRKKAVARTAKRRRPMKGAPAKRRSPRRMNGAKQDGEFVKDALTGAAGALLAGYMPKLASKVMKDKPINPHIINGVSALVGYGIFKAAPKMRALGVGLVIGGVANSAAQVINSIPGMNGRHTNDIARVPAAVRREIENKVNASMRMLGADPATLTGMDAATLTGADPATLTGTYSNGI